MKRIGLIAAIATAVTVGGVYATWNYATGTATKATQTISAGLSAVDVNTAKGDISVDTKGLTFTIEQDKPSFNAMLLISGSIKVTFTAADGADQDVIDNGINMQYTIKESFGEYKGVDVFTVTSTAISLGTAKEVTIPAADLAENIRLGAINLPTKAAYDEFAGVLKAGQFTFTFSEVAA